MYERNVTEEATFYIGKTTLHKPENCNIVDTSNEFLGELNEIQCSKGTALY